MNTKISRNLLCFLTLAVCGVPAFANPLIILSESWSNGTRTNQNLPNSSAWFSSAPMELNVTAGNFTQGATSTTMAITYFTDDKNVPIQLQVGETLKVEYSYSLAGVQSGSGGLLRMGVFNSQPGVGRIGADSFEMSENAFTNYRGYVTSINNPRSGETRIIKRSLSGNNLMSAGTAYEEIGELHTDWSGLLNDTIYTAQFLITRNAEDVTLTTVLRDSVGTIVFDYTRTDDSTPFTAFDSFAFLLGGTVADSFTLYSLDVAVIPEASTYAWSAAFAAGFGLMVFVRRRRGNI